MNVINEGINRARHKDRDTPLDYHNRENSDEFVPFITTYHPDNFQIRRILKDLNPILMDPSLANMFPTHPRLVFRQPPSIRCTVVSSLFSQTNYQIGTFACGKPRCLTCKHVCKDNDFDPPLMDHHINN